MRTNEVEFDMEVEADVARKSTSRSVNALTVRNNIARSQALVPVVQTARECVMVSPGTMPSVTISLHPLVIMNVSEHWTRLRAQEGSPQKVIGALIGTHKERKVEIMNSFELLFKIVDGDYVIDRDYYNTKEEQFKQVFSEMDFLGWYTTTDNPTEQDISIHKQICEINECPILLTLNPMSRHMDKLPVAVYESIIDLIAGEATMFFISLAYTFATEEAERIGVDHVARMINIDAGENSVVAEHLQAQHSAIKMLHSRVRLVLEYMRGVENGERTASHEILRDAYTLSHTLPVVQSELFRTEFTNQCDDVGLVSYLATITKGTNAIHHLINKCNLLYERKSMGHRRGGLFF